jgi:formiminoglutamate deiminase
MGLWFARALTPDGWRDSVRLDIKDGRITSLEIGVPTLPGDERHGTALPGVPNLHSHAFQRGMAGLSEARGESADSFWTWRRTMYRFLDRLTPEDVEALAAMAYAEMLEGGFTRVGEFHYLHHDRDGSPYARLGEMASRIAAAADATGIALTLMPVFYAHADFGGAPPDEEQKRFVSSLDAFGRLVEEARGAAAALPGATVGIAPHSLRAVTPDELAQVASLAPDGPIHIHVAEQTREVEACLAWSGQRPVAWLLDHAQVDARWCLIHATHVVLAELQDIVARGATVGLCPVTEANLGDGIFPAAEFDGAFGVGTDSNVQIGVAQELSMLEYGQRLTRRQRNVLASGPGCSTARTLFDRALAGGAQALGVAQTSIAEGAAADIVTLRPELADGVSGDTLLDRWIFASPRPMVDSVWRAGRRVVVDGLHVDRDRTTAAYRATLTRLLCA